MERNRYKSCLCILAVVASTCVLASIARAVPIYGGPTDPSTGSIFDSLPSGAAGDGRATATIYKYVYGTRAVRWDAFGSPATELDHLGTDSNGNTESRVSQVSAAGVAVGFANRYEADLLKGRRAVRWDASGTAAIELAHLGTDPTGY